MGKKGLLPTFQYELALKEAGYEWIAGIDEAGRGPLAGPVVAAAVLLKPAAILPNLNDSKKLSAQRREELFPLIQQEAHGIGIGMVDAQEIDQINILQATFAAMKKAILNLPFAPQVLLIDGRDRIPRLSIPQLTVIQGDQKVCSIAAASIVAKVTRDRLMRYYDQQFPHYQFAKHFGYGTKEHKALLSVHGLSPIHRCSFLHPSKRTAAKRINLQKR